MDSRKRRMSGARMACLVLAGLLAVNLFFFGLQHLIVPNGSSPSVERWLTTIALIAGACCVSWAMVKVARRKRAG